MSGSVDRAPQWGGHITQIQARMAAAVMVGVWGAIIAWHGLHTGAISDFTHLWFAGRAWLGGQDPYTVIGPGRAFVWPLPLLYPLPAVLLAVPFAPLTAHAADIAFAGISAGLFSFAITHNGFHRLPAVLSFSFFFAESISQWSPILVAAALLPSLGFILAAKPTIGAALFCYRPSWRIFGSGLLLMIACVLIQPRWPAEWFAATRQATHVTAPILHLGGPVVLLALLRWRRPEARLLIALACVPHTTLLYESLPLFLIPETWQESVLLVALTWIARTVSVRLGPYPTLAAHTATSATVIVALCYLPCLIMILRRPNEGDDLTELRRAFAWVGRLRNVVHENPTNVRESRAGQACVSWTSR